MMYLNKLIMSFPSFMCDGPFVFALLEVLSLLRKACEGEFVDEVCRVLSTYSNLTSLAV